MDKKSPNNRKDGDTSERYYPKFLVTQSDYDAATPEKRSRYNYVVDETVLEPPQHFSIPDES